MGEEKKKEERGGVTAGSKLAGGSERHPVLKMSFKPKLILISFLTAGLTVFYYVHEYFPKPLRAATSLLATPTAVASGISHYLKLGIPVYETPIAVVFANLIASVLVVSLGNKFLIWRKKKRAN